MGQIISSILCGRETNKRIILKQQQQQQREASKPEHFLSIENHPSSTTTTTSNKNFRPNNHNHNHNHNSNSNNVSIISPTPTRHGNGSKIRRIGEYKSSQRILLVGEGDLSFSASLSRAFVSASNIISTSVDSFEYLERNYSRSMKNVAELKGRGCMVLHEINATEIADHAVLGSMKFDRIVFNFPLAGFFGRQVPRDLQIGMNQALVYLFMGNAKKMIREDGEIHITHKSYGFFLQWNLQ